MSRREMRESIFQLLFMTEFNAVDEMAQQRALYLDGVENIQDKNREYIQNKFEKIVEKTENIA